MSDMSSISDKKVYKLVGQIYETAKDHSSEAWLDVYEQMSQILVSGAGSLSLYSDKSSNFDFVAHNLDKELVAQYNDYYQYISPFRQKIVEMNTGEIFNRGEHLSDQGFAETELYQDCFKKYGIFNYQYQVLFKNSNVSGGVSFSRPATMNNFGKSESNLLKLVIPHLQRAFQVYMKIAEIERDKRMMIECLEKISENIIVVDKTGKIVYLNKNAKNLIEQDNGLQISRDGMLTAILAHETKKLRILCQSVFNPDINSKINFGGILQISRSAGLRPLSVVISPFSEQNSGNFSSETFALLFINDPHQKVERLEPILREMYGLTAAEAKIAAILAQGNSLNEACQTLSIKQNTVRTHLKRIFSKTDTNRQSELVKLVLSSPANLKIDNLSKA
jgi:DNA-binding CsgD family transcriptional regulator